MLDGIRTRKRGAGELPFSENGKAVVPFGDSRGQMASLKRTKGLTLIKRDPYDGPNGELVKAFDDYGSRQIVDPFKSLYANANVIPTNIGPEQLIQPTFDPLALMKLPVQNNTLMQCIAAMKTNIESFGFTLEYIGPKGQEKSSEAKAEKDWASSLLEQPNDEETLSDIREKCRVDYETLGYSGMEVGRDGDGNVVWIQHATMFSYRMTGRDPEPTKYPAYIYRNGKLVQQTFSKRFRRFVQLVGSKKVYFKEFGDPRKISTVTGAEDLSLKPEDEATEILFMNQYITGEVYGLPRHINQLPSLLGSREQEVTNLQFFRDNGIPALAVLVSGGLLTDETITLIESAFNRVKGQASMNRVMVIEAQAVSDYVQIESSNPATPKLELKPLTGERQQDELFQKYDENCRLKVRSSYRLPPVYLGLSDDYTRATIEASIEVADAQVFSPERLKVDKLVNSKILIRDKKPLIFWQFRSNPAKLVSGSAILDSLAKFEAVGAMTPNLAITLANEMLDLHIPPIKEEWGNMPFKFVEALILTGKLRPTGLDSLPAGLVPDNSANGGQGGPTVADAKKVEFIQRFAKVEAELQELLRAKRAEGVRSRTRA